MMTDFNIRRGLSTVLFSEPGVVNSNVIIEEGCWYLCTDTAELYVGVSTEKGVELKRINGGSFISDQELVNIRNEIAAVQTSIPTKISQLENDGNYATEQFVSDAIESHEALAAIEEVKVKLETEVLPIIPTVQETIIPAIQKVEEIVPVIEELKTVTATQDWVQKQGFVTEVFVNEKISEVEIPEVPTKVSELENDKGYITLEEIPAIDLSSKADEIPFLEDIYVTKPMGGFIKGESAKGLTVAQILAKLLELSDEPCDNPDAPETPQTPEEIIKYLTNKNASIYVYNENDSLEIVEFTEYVEWTKQESEVKMDGISTKYIIKDGDTAIEAGYQQATTYSDTYWLTVALPSEITDIKVKLYDPDVPGWVEPLWHMVPADTQTIDGYTIWTVPEEFEIDAGSTYRFVINN